MRSIQGTFAWRVTGEVYFRRMTNHSATKVIDCYFCSSELEHCHGVAIMIEESVYVCSDDPDCVLAAELHGHMVIDDNADAYVEFPIAG
jgi:hypothetical protein